MANWSKKLSKNDIDPAQSHQSGINATKSGLQFFRQVDKDKNIDHKEIQVLGINQEILTWTLSWYSSKNEIHITGSGPYLRSIGVGTGDTITLNELGNSKYQLDVQGPAFESSSETRLKETLTKIQDGELTPGQGFLHDVKVKTAIENHAMELARKHYEDLGYEVIDTSRGNPFDLQCDRDDESFIVEVKGTSTAGECVWLTKNEVERFKSEYPKTSLIVISGIKYAIDGDEVSTDGGELREFRPWKPKDSHLTAIQFKYEIPE